MKRIIESILAKIIKICAEMYYRLGHKTLIALSLNTKYDDHDVMCGDAVEMIKKLAHYEDLEEQGRLMVLPCKVNEVVWAADGKFPAQKVLYIAESAILSDMEDGYCIGYTKEEAEAKLEELKEGNE